MNPSLLDDLLTLQRKDTVKQASGTVQETWVTITTVYGGVDYSRGNRETIAGLTKYGYPVRLILRRRIDFIALGFAKSEYYENMRFLHDGKIIKVLSVINEKRQTIIEGSES